MTEHKALTQKKQGPEMPKGINTVSFCVIVLPRSVPCTKVSISMEIYTHIETYAYVSVETLHIATTS